MFSVHPVNTKWTRTTSFELVSGLGVREEEYSCYVFPFGTPAERIEKCKEFLFVLENLCTSSDFSFGGKFYTLHNAVVKPKPIQKPHPPISIAAVGKRLITTIPEWGAGWFVQDLPGFKPYIEMVRWMDNSCHQRGIDPKQLERGAKLQIIWARLRKNWATQ